MQTICYLPSSTVTTGGASFAWTFTGCKAGSISDGTKILNVFAHKTWSYKPIPVNNYDWTESWQFVVKILCIAFPK